LPIPDAGPSNNPNDPHYISATGMGWFPGYAINLETGERLNIVFGENSWLVGENGRDMLLEPNTNASLIRQVLFLAVCTMYMLWDRKQWLEPV
jgi:hypothetical protein